MWFFCFFLVGFLLPTLVLGLCEDLSLSPGLYDVQHALRVAKGLERRWHQASRVRFSL
jgi:hypothetical protein